MTVKGNWARAGVLCPVVPLAPVVGDISNPTIAVSKWHSPLVSMPSAQRWFESALPVQRWTRVWMKMVSNPPRLQESAFFAPSLRRIPQRRAFVTSDTLENHYCSPRNVTPRGCKCTSEQAATILELHNGIWILINIIINDVIFYDGLWSDLPHRFIRLPSQEVISFLTWSLSSFYSCKGVCYLLSVFKWCFCPWLLEILLLILSSCNRNGDNSPLTCSHLNTWSISMKLKSMCWGWRIFDRGFSFCIPVIYLLLFPQPFFKVSPSFVSRESRHLVLTGSLCMAWWWSPFSGFHSSFYSCRY